MELIYKVVHIFIKNFFTKFTSFNWSVSFFKLNISTNLTISVKTINKIISFKMIKMEHIKKKGPLFYFLLKKKLNSVI